MVKRYRAFDVFLAGAMAFLAGASLTTAMSNDGWSRRDLILIVFTVGALAYSARLLRDLYHAQAV